MGKLSDWFKSGYGRLFLIKPPRFLRESGLYATYTPYESKTPDGIVGEISNPRYRMTPKSIMHYLKERAKGNRPCKVQLQNLDENNRNRRYYTEDAIRDALRGHDFLAEFDPFRT